MTTLRLTDNITEFYVTIVPNPQLIKHILANLTILASWKV